MKIKLDQGAYAPIRAHETDAGADLRTPIEFTIGKRGKATIDTGVHVEIPIGYKGTVCSKSGLNVKENIICPNGTVDCGYTGSIVVKLYNLGDAVKHFHAGDKICQLIIEPCELCDFEIVDSLEETERGEKGFGSTGR